ncbi:MAG: FAD-binding protein, partial [Polaribacter sp.]|nr:FAD-binding protein [Polaribacter sp.]
MNIQKNVSLKNYNTFGISANAKRFISVNSVYELQQILKVEKDIFLISGGSNMLLTTDIDKLVVHINIKGVSIDNENENAVYLTVNAGENWHDFVLWCISQNYGGIENLSLIPGYVGTCPIQNIGAYGVEVKDTITKVEALDIETGKLVQFSNKDCNFGYRDSIFKNEGKGKYIVTSVSFKLTTIHHNLNSSYGAIETELSLKKISKPSLKDI